VSVDGRDKPGHDGLGAKEAAMRGFLIGVIATLAVASVAHADMSGLVGNTVIGSTPDGLTRRVQLRADGSYLITVSDGSSSKGTWKADEARLCYTRIDPPPAAGGQNPLCVEGFDGHKVGDKWTATGHNNLPMTMTVIAGQ
jgi:hypothetical protein